MSIQKIRQYNSARSPDETPLYVIRKDFSGGINNRQHASLIGENQVVVLTNGDIGVMGEISKRPGSTLIGNDLGAVTFADLHNYERQGYSGCLVGYVGTMLYEWLGSGNWLSATSSAFTASQTDVSIISAKESGLVPDDIIIVQNGTDEPKRFHKDSSDVWACQPLGTATGASASMPRTTVMAWYGNRIWTLKNDLLSFSDAYDADYSTAFDTVTNKFRVPVGEERAIVPTRETGMIVMGNNAIWGLAPSVIPVATDQPQPIVTNRGVVSKKAWVNAGDDIYYFAQDGFRALKRTTLDKLQAGVDFPLSYNLKDEFAKISFPYIANLRMEYFDNKIFIAVPTGATTFDTWIYYTALKTFAIIEGWSPAEWSLFKINGEERLYYSKYGDGTVYRAWYGYTDEGTTTINGTAITMTIDSREENLGQPLMFKNGGEIEIETEVAGSDDTLTVNVSLDGGAFTLLGTVSLDSETAPVLPVTLPFTLADSYVVRKKFHLESLEKWKTIQIEVINSDSNIDPVKFYGYNIMSFQEAYENE